MAHSVSDRIKEVLATTFNIPIAAIGDESAQHDIAEWDSVGHANMLLCLEDEFGVTLPDDAMPTLTSVPRLVAYFSKFEPGS